jgi:hypothetical protein
MDVYLTQFCSHVTVIIKTEKFSEKFIHISNVTSMTAEKKFIGRKRFNSIFLPSMARQPLGGLGHLIIDASRSHFLDTPHSVGLLWTRDQVQAAIPTET